MAVDVHKRAFKRLLIIFKVNYEGVMTLHEGELGICAHRIPPSGIEASVVVEAADPSCYKETCKRAHSSFCCIC